MDNGLYTTLNRQSGLMQEMQVVANNIANMSTTGFRREGVIFAEHVADLKGEEPSLSMATAEGRAVNLSQGVLQQTSGRFDLAIEGEGTGPVLGRHVVRMSNDVGARDTLKGRLKAAGCAIVEASDWHRAGDFDGAVPKAEAPKEPSDKPPPAPVLLAPLENDEEVNMKLHSWLHDQADQHTDAARGKPVAFSQIDREAEIPAGASARLLANLIKTDETLNERWGVVKSGGGHIVLDLLPPQIRDVERDRFGRRRR